MAASWTDDLRDRLDELLDEHREALHRSLDDLTEDEARRSLVPSLTTLLGLVKHVTWVERVWWGQAVRGGSRASLGIVETQDESFVLAEDDTIASVRAAHLAAWEESRRVAAGLALDDVVTGRGERVVWAIRTHLLRELAQHCGHADILREQVLAARQEKRSGSPAPTRTTSG